LFGVRVVGLCHSVPHTAEALAEQTVTASFDEEPLPEIMAVICRLVEAECVLENSTIRVSDPR
jgi:hypothetical protein